MLESATKEKKQFSSLEMHFRWFGLLYGRKPLTMLYKATASDCRHVCKPMVEHNVIIHVADTDSYI